MPFKYRTSAPPASPGAIAAVEDQIRIKLPPDYVQFVRAQNGGSVGPENKYSYAVPDDFPDPPLSMEGFFQVEELPGRRQRIHQALGLDLLPVGMDDFGNYVCLGVLPGQIGKVFFLDHELTDDKTGQRLVVRIADSFGSFVAGLESDRG